MTKLFQSVREAKTMEIEDTDREGFPYRLVVALRKLGQVSMLDYFLSTEEAEDIVKALSKAASPSR